MQSKTTRGVPRLLVSTGVISLVLSVAAPAALAKSPDRPSEDADRKVWVCHKTRSATNPIEINLVSVNAVAHEDELAADQDALDAFKNKAELMDALDDTLLGSQCPATVGSGGPTGGDLEGDGPGNSDGTPGGGNDNNGTDQDGGTGGDLEGDGPGNSDGTPGGGNDNNGTDQDGGTGGDLEGDGPGNSDGTPGGGNDNNGTDQDGGTGGDLEGDGPGNSDGTPGGGNDDNGTDQDGGTGGDLEGDGDEVVNGPGQPAGTPVVKTPPAAAPAQPLPPAATTRPVIIISTDTVAKPVTPAPAARATPAKPKVENEVLGAITTRTPTPGLGALDPGAQTAGSITALAATGSSTTTVLVVVGLVLLLAGFGLQLGAQRLVRSSDLAA